MLFRSPIESAKKIAQLTKKTCILTLGEDGAFACNSKNVWRVPALALDPIDTTAAGDCFVGWLAARLASGDNLEQSLRWASVAAGKACLISGAQTSLPDFRSVEASLSDLPQYS